MTLVLKSNQKANKSIGNIFGIIGATDFSLMLDFNQQMYLKRLNNQTVNLNLSEAISFTRNSKAAYFDEEQNLKIAAVNEPRIHFDAISGKKGLLLEPATTQLLSNPHSPASQTITITHNANDRLVLSCKGAGRVALSGNVSLVLGSAAYASENSPAMYQTTATGTVTVTVTGSLEMFSLHFVSAVNGSNDRMFTPPDATTVAAESCKLNPDIFNEILSGKAQYTIVMNVQESKRPVPNVYASRNNVFALLENTSGNKGIYISRTVGASGRLRAYFQDASGATVKTVNKAVDDTVYNHTYVLSVNESGSGAFVARNGEIEKLDAAYSVSPNEMVIGSTVAYLANSYLNGIVTMLAIYPRKMSYTEAQELSKSRI